MGKTKIDDMAKLIELRNSGWTLRQIGAHFNVSPEAVRLALLNTKEKERQMKKMINLLVQGNKPARNTAKVIEDWIVILQGAKKAALLEEEIANLNERLSQIESRVYQLTDKIFEGQNTRHSI